MALLMMSTLDNTKQNQIEIITQICHTIITQNHPVGAQGFAPNLYAQSLRPIFTPNLCAQSLRPI